MTTGDEFFDRLRVLINHVRRIATSEDEILVDCSRSREDFTLAHDAPTATQRAASATKYVWTTTPGATQIIWGEWAWKT